MAQLIATIGPDLAEMFRQATIAFVIVMPICASVNSIFDDMQHGNM